MFFHAIVLLYEEGNMTVKQICEITSVSRSSLYRKIHDLN
ncbi:helix-turn-helix domain-containing protein [Bacillus toyonensis]